MSSAAWMGFLYQSTGWCWFNHKSRLNSLCCCCTQFTVQKGWKCLLWNWSSVKHNWLSNQMDYVEASKFCWKSLLSWISRQRPAHGRLLCDLISRHLSSLGLGYGSYQSPKPWRLSGVWVGSAMISIYILGRLFEIPKSLLGQLVGPIIKGMGVETLRLTTPTNGRIFSGLCFETKHKFIVQTYLKKVL